MIKKRYESLLARRAFLARAGAGVTALGAATASVPAAGAQAEAERRWQPARHEQDDWLERIPGKHRFIFDSITPDAFGSAMLFANNYFIANQNGYGLQSSDLAVVIVARHFSTPFAFNDAIWAKYGAPIAQQINFNDPKTKQAPAANLYNAAGPGLANSGVTLESLIKRGVHFAVCQMATRFFAGRIARETGGDSEAIYKELAANLVANSHLAPAGIVAVNRAQERGYSFVHA